MERMKCVALFTLVAVLSSCSIDSKNNDVIDEQTIESSKHDSLVPGLFDARSGYLIEEMTVDNVQILFSRNVDGDTTKKWSFDSRFVTPEGYKVGMTWAMLPAELQKDVLRYPGWNFSVPLKNGWHLCFCEGPSCTDTLPSDTSKVQWIEKWN